MLNWKKYVGSPFIVRFFHKPRDTNPNKYPSSTPSNISIENEADISLLINPQMLMNICAVIQARLQAQQEKTFYYTASDCLTIKTGY